MSPFRADTAALPLCLVAALWRPGLGAPDSVCYDRLENSTTMGVALAAHGAPPAGLILLAPTMTAGVCERKCTAKAACTAYTWYPAQAGARRPSSTGAAVSARSPVCYGMEEMEPHLALVTPWPGAKTGTKAPCRAGVAGPSTGALGASSHSPVIQPDSDFYISGRTGRGGAWAIFFGVLRSLGTTCILVIGGLWLARAGAIDKDGARALSTIGVKLLIPCLLFARVITAASLELIASAWPACILPFVYVPCGAFLGYVCAIITQPERDFERGMVAAVAFGNSTGLPIIILSVVNDALMTPQIHELIASGHAHTAPPTDPLVYLSLYTLTYPILQWSLGNALLSGALCPGRVSRKPAQVEEEGEEDGVEGGQEAQEDRITEAEGARVAAEQEDHEGVEAFRTSPARVEPAVQRPPAPTLWSPPSATPFADRDSAHLPTLPEQPPTDGGRSDLEQGGAGDVPVLLDEGSGTTACATAGDSGKLEVLGPLPRLSLGSDPADLHSPAGSNGYPQFKVRRARSDLLPSRASLGLEEGTPPRPRAAEGDTSGTHSCGQGCPCEAHAAFASAQPATPTAAGPGAASLSQHRVSAAVLIRGMYGQPVVQRSASLPPGGLGPQRKSPHHDHLHHRAHHNQNHHHRLRRRRTRASVALHLNAVADGEAGPTVAPPMKEEVVDRVDPVTGEHWLVRRTFYEEGRLASHHHHGHHAPPIASPSFRLKPGETMVSFEDREDTESASSTEDSTHKVGAKVCRVWAERTVAFILDKVLVPPVRATLLGLLLGLIPWTRWLLVTPVDGPDAPLGWVLKGITKLGEAAVPTNLITLGASLAKGPDFKAVSLTGCLAIAVAKLVCMPAVALAMALLDTHVLPDRIPRPFQQPFLLTMFVVAATPTANNVLIMCTLNGQNRTAMSTSIFVQYLCSPVVLTLTISAFIGFMVDEL